MTEVLVSTPDDIALRTLVKYLYNNGYQVSSLRGLSLNSLHGVDTGLIINKEKKTVIGCEFSKEMHNGYDVVEIEYIQDDLENLHEGVLVNAGNTSFKDMCTLQENRFLEDSPKSVKETKQETLKDISGSPRCTKCRAYLLEGYTMCESCETLEDFGERFESIKQVESKPEFVRGEEVEVWDDNEEAIDKGQYITTIDHEYRYIVDAEDLGYPCGYKHIRKLQPTGEVKKFTKEYLYNFAEKSYYYGGCLLKEFCEKHNMLEG